MRASFVLLPLLAMLACGEDDSVTVAQLWCEGLCSAAIRCGANVTRRDCENDCSRSRPGLARLSIDGAAALGECIETMSCADVLGDDERWSAAHEACWQNAKFTVSPTPHVRAFCARYTLALFECRYWYSTDECEDDFSMWSDATQDGVDECSNRQSCDDRDACEEAVFSTP